MVEKQIPANLVVISGMHGSGKDTLIEDFITTVKENTALREYMDYDVKRYTKCDMTSFEDNFERQIRRIAKYGIDWYRAIKMAVENPDSIILMDRGYLDAKAYLTAFYMLNWMDTSEYKMLHNLLDIVFSAHNTMKMDPFILCPPFDLIEENLAKRKAEGKTKWNEDNEEYNKIVYKNYVFSAKEIIDVEDPPPECPYSCYPKFCFNRTQKIVTCFCREKDRKKRVNILLKYCNERYAKFKKSDQYELMKAGKYSEFHPALRDRKDDVNGKEEV